MFQSYQLSISWNIVDALVCLLFLCRLNKLWREYVHHDQHCAARRKQAKCKSMMSLKYLHMHLSSYWAAFGHSVLTKLLCSVYNNVIWACVCVWQFPIGPGGDGPMGGMGGMEPHHMNGSLGKSFFNTNNHFRTYSWISLSAVHLLCLESIKACHNSMWNRSFHAWFPDLLSFFALRDYATLWSLKINHAF